MITYFLSCLIKRALKLCKINTCQILICLQLIGGWEEVDTAYFLVSSEDRCCIHWKPWFKRLETYFGRVKKWEEMIRPSPFVWRQWAWILAVSDSKNLLKMVHPDCNMQMFETCSENTENLESVPWAPLQLSCQKNFTESWSGCHRHAWLILTVPFP